MAVSAQAEIPSQFGRSAIVTGATGGLGYAAALALAKAGAEVILTGRDARKGQTAIEQISRDVSGANDDWLKQNHDNRSDSRTKLPKLDALSVAAGSSWRGR
jgi:NAD(P)-dependent dehydrogenase (short-subunit alcohol dehydrogenase family)